MKIIRLLILSWIIIFIFAVKFDRGKKPETVFVPTVTPLPTIAFEREVVMVARVIDGDTIELSDKRKVRYIGINSPEMGDKRSVVACMAQKAKEANEQLVLGKNVELEKDVSQTDKYKRLLRYVWVDGVMVNQKLVEMGMAQVATFPPDVKYKDLFLESQRLVTPATICTGI